MNNRRFDLSTPIMQQGFYHLSQNFLIDISSYDLIKGYRADDSYFSFAEAFLSNQISYKQLQEAMKLGKLGEQFGLKSKKAFNKITYTGYEIAEGNKYCTLRKMRLEKAKEEYKNVTGKLDLKGIYIRDLILEEVKKMTRAYDKFFLPGVMNNLGFAFDFAVNGCDVAPDSFYDFFIASKVSSAIEDGSPAFICGCSGTELVLTVFDRVGFKSDAVDKEFIRFDRSPEYWAGWVLAYYQWLSGTFRCKSSYFTAV